MINVTITGLADVRRELAALAPKLRVRAVRNALAAGARIVRDEARRLAPVISPAAPLVQRGWRRPGTLRRAISVRTSKQAKRDGNVGVFVNVRPARRAAFRGRVQVRASQRGAKSPLDPYYWRWVEFGHRIVGRYKGKYADYKVRGRGRRTGLSVRRRSPIGSVQPIPFLRTAARKLNAALGVIMPKLQQAIAKLNTPNATAP